MARAYIEVPLSGKIAAGRAALIDIDDYWLVIPHTWFVFERVRGARKMGPYAWTNWTYEGGRRSLIRMHQLIMGDRNIDHIFHDGLDNRRSQLRIATRSQQQQNTRRHADGSSRYKGVRWRKDRGYWQALICKDRKIKTLGSFHNEEDAAKAYDEAAREMFGEFAYLNFP